MSLFSPVLIGLEKIGLRKEARDEPRAAVARACRPVARCLLEQLEHRRLLAGNGLQAEYFNGKDFNTHVVTRVDPTIDFNWRIGSPAAGVNSNFFSARWTGKVAPTATGNYTFYTQSDDGIRVWVNNQPVINNWTDHASTENSGSITLTGGQLYDIRVEYYEGINDALARLSWAGPGIGKQVVPTSALYTPDATGPVDPPDPQLPVVSLFATAWSIDENATTGVTIEISRLGNTADALSVPLQTSGTATHGTDYSLPLLAVIPAGQNSVKLTLMPIDDTIVEGDETIVVSIQPTASFVIGASDKWTIALKDNDTATQPEGPGQAGLKAEYFRGRSFDTKVLERTHATINFDWGYGIPATGMPSDSFSVRWTGYVTVPTTGRWTFLTESDDGVRLWVNGQQLVNQWNDHAPTEHSGGIDLVAGVSYAIRMEYYEAGNGAVAKLRWQGPGTARAVVPASALSSTGSTTPAPVLPTVSIRSADTQGREHTDSVEFTVSRTGATTDPLTVRLAYSGTAEAADIQGGLPSQVIIPAGVSSITTTLLPAGDWYIEGTETLVVAIANDSVYSIDSNNSVTLYIADVTVPAGDGNGLKAEYFNGRSFGTKILERVDSTVNFDWGYGTPAPGVGADNFSVRWTGQVKPPTTGTWTFYTTSDDGVRLWVNGQLLIDQWNDHAPTEHSGSINLDADKYYDIRMEYYEAGNGAVARLHWAGPGALKQVVSTDRLYSEVVAPVLPRVSISSDDPIGAEPDDPMSFTLTRTGPTTQPLTVQLAASGSVSNADIAGGIPPQITIPAGKDSITVPLHPVTDGQIEATETLILTIKESTGYHLAEQSRLSLTLFDRSAGTLWVTGEPAGNLATGYFIEGIYRGIQFVVVRTGSLEASVVVPLSYSGTTSPEDFLDPLPASVVIPAGQDRVVVTREAVADDGFEGTETLRVTLGNVNGYSIVDDGTLDMALRESSYDPGWSELPRYSPGFRAEYYNGPPASDPVIVRRNPTIDFDWGAGSPDPLVSADHFSVVWTGYVTPPASGDWTFYAAHKGKLNLQVQSTAPFPSVRQLVEGDSDESSLTVNLEGGKDYFVSLSYVDQIGDAQMALSWSGPGVSRQIIPTDAVKSAPLGYAALLPHDDYGNEEGNPVNFVIYHSPSVQEDRVVFLTYFGSATADDFIEELPTRVVIPAGRQYTGVTLTPRKDSIAEGLEFLTPHIVPSPHYSFEPTPPLVLHIFETPWKSTDVPPPFNW